MLKSGGAVSEIGVSVVMPAYNAADTIRASVRSVLAQTHPKWELIVVDDGSSDDTGRIIREMAACDSRIKVMNNDMRCGVSEARNRGVRAARYDWIAFLDSDDLWKAEKLEKQLQVLSQAENVSICFTGSVFIDQQGQSFGYEMKVPARITRKELLKQNLISCSSVMVKKSRMLEYPMCSDPMIHEDFAAWLRILQQEPYAVGIDEPLLVYRLSRKSKSGNKLRSAKMQWRTYRFLGIGRMEAVICFAAYVRRNSRKYAAILSSNGSEENYG